MPSEKTEDAALQCGHVGTADVWTVGGRGSADANGEKSVAMGTGDCGRRRLEVQVSCMGNILKIYGWWGPNIASIPTRYDTR